MAKAILKDGTEIENVTDEQILQFALDGIVYDLTDDAGETSQVNYVSPREAVEPEPEEE